MSVNPQQHQLPSAHFVSAPLMPRSRIINMCLLPATMPFVQTATLACDGHMAHVAICKAYTAMSFGCYCSRHCAHQNQSFKPPDLTSLLLMQFMIGTCLAIIFWTTGIVKKPKFDWPLVSQQLHLAVAGGRMSDIQTLLCTTRHLCGPKLLAAGVCGGFGPNWYILSSEQLHAEQRCAVVSLHLFFNML